MYNTSMCLIKYLNSKGENFFIGEKVRDDIEQSTNKKKKKYNNISIISSLSQDEIQNMFTNSIKYDNCIKINFGLYEFYIYSFKSMTKENVLERQKINLLIKSINYTREKNDFTINSLIMDEKENIIDYTFKYKNHRISSLNDVNNKIIRIVGNPNTKIKENPILILKAIKLLSTLKYKIEDNTLENMNKYKYLLQDLDKRIIINEFNEILKGKNIHNAIKLMLEMDFFKLKIENKYKFFKFICNKQILINLYKLNKYSNVTLIEIYTVIFKDKYNDIEKELKPLEILNDNDIEKVKWLVKNFNIINKSDEELRIEIYNSIDEFLKKEGLMLLKDLLNKLINIHNLLGNKIDKNKIMFALCSRPYFYEQLKISDSDIIKIYNEKYNNYDININKVKDKILHELIISDKYPKGDLFYKRIYDII